MNPAKRKRIYRAQLAENAKTPVLQEKQPQPVVEKPVELPIGLKELPKEELTTTVVEKPVVVEVPAVEETATAVTSSGKKKKV